MQTDRVSLQARRYFDVLRPLLADDARFAAFAGWDGDYDGDPAAAAWFEAFYDALVEHALVLACGDAGRFILRETAMVALHYGMLDDVLLRADSAWHGPEGRDAALRRAADRAFATSSRRAPATGRSSWAISSSTARSRPGPASTGGRARCSARARRSTRASGCAAAGGSSASAPPSAWSPTWPGPSCAPRSPAARPIAGTRAWYASGVADWWSGRHKTLAR